MDCFLPLLVTWWGWLSNLGVLYDHCCFQGKQESEQSGGPCSGDTAKWSPTFEWSRLQLGEGHK